MSQKGTSKTANSKCVVDGFHPLRKAKFCVVLRQTFRNFETPFCKETYGCTAHVIQSIISQAVSSIMPQKDKIPSQNTGLNLIVWFFVSDLKSFANQNAKEATMEPSTEPPGVADEDEERPRLPSSLPLSPSAGKSKIRAESISKVPHLL
eukprot:g65954.t1